ncbi:MAG: hypothetical protein ACJ79C_04225 [Myxococcales bacterium]
MRIERPESPAGGVAGTEAACGGFRIAFDGDRPLLRLIPGERRLASGMPDAVLRGLSDAPALLASALSLLPPPRPYDRVEVALHSGEHTTGEAMNIGSGCIRLSLGEATSEGEAAGIARHEALHLLLARALRGGERWIDPELAFADWIVRAIEGFADPRVPRFQTPLPRMLDPVPATRLEVQKRLATIASSPQTARRYFGERLFGELTRIAVDAGADTAPAVPAVIVGRQLWLVEAAIGTYYLEAAGTLPVEDADALRPIVLDDWLLDYEQYARAVSNPPSGAGHVFRLTDPGWSSDPVVRLSVAAQALQRDDGCFFTGPGSRADEPILWKNRGHVKLPLLPGRVRSCPAPIHALRSVLREIPAASRALEMVDDAARGEAQHFEARALWPRILARLLAADLSSAAEADGPVPAVQIVDGDDAAVSREVFREWTAAADALRVLAGELGVFLPRILGPQHVAVLADAQPGLSSVVLVHTSPLRAETLREARLLAARRPIRAALFRDHLDRGRPYEEVGDLPPPLDPRYREEIWVAGAALPVSPWDLVSLSDQATAGGFLTTPVSHLLSATAIGIAECHVPPRPAPSPRAGHG